jgi:hypothetical protein
MTVALQRLFFIRRIRACGSCEGKRKKSSVRHAAHYDVAKDLESTLSSIVVPNSKQERPTDDARTDLKCRR